MSERSIISVRCLVEDTAGNILVVERGHHGRTGRGGWLELPGGKADAFKQRNGQRTTFVERLLLNAKKEVNEESGLIVACQDNPSWVTSYIIPDGPHAGTLCSVYGVIGTAVGGELRVGAEETAVAWLAPDIITANTDCFTKVSLQTIATMAGQTILPRLQAA